MKFHGYIFLSLLVLVSCSQNTCGDTCLTQKTGGLLQSGALFKPNSGSLVPIQGRAFEISDFTGVPVAVLFWTDTCDVSCKNSLELLSQAEIQKKRIVGIFSGNTGSMSIPPGFSGFISHDSQGEYWKALGGKIFPTLLILNEKQIISHIFEGNAQIQEYMQQSEPVVGVVPQSKYYLGFQSGSSYQGSSFREKDSLGAFSFHKDIQGIGFDLSGGWFISNDIIIAAKKPILRIHATGSGLALGFKIEKIEKITVFINGEKLNPGDTPQRLDENGAMYIKDSGNVQILPDTRYLSGALIDIHADAGIGIEYFEFK